MANHSGHAFLLKAAPDATSDQFTTLAGFRIQHMTITAGSISLSATGVFMGSSAEVRVRSHAFKRDLLRCQLSFEDGDKLQGQMLVTKMEYIGDFNGERSYSIDLVSQGEMVHA